MSDKNYEIIWRPQAGPQTHLITCPVGEVFFGGSRGGGKTDSAIGDWARHSNAYGEQAAGIMFRRSFKQLEEVLKRTRELYPKIGASYSVSNQQWTFPNRSTLKLRHLDSELDAPNYQGHSYNWMCFEEVTNWPNSRAIDMLKGTLRSGSGVPTRLLLTGNPGGVGHNWVKARYITPAPRGYTLIRDVDSGLDRIYIPSRLTDNQILVQNDPQYAARLRQTGSAAMVRAWLEGDWDIVAGGFFDDVFRAEAHILPTFAIPQDWQLIFSFDWGFSAPSSLGVFARCSGSQPSPQIFRTLNGKRVPLVIPRGSMIRVKELYTVQYDESGYPKPNVGKRLSNEELGMEVAKVIKSLWAPRVFVADPSIFTESGGPSIYEQMRRGARSLSVNLTMTKADNTREAGWPRMRELLSNAALETPEKAGLWVTDNCQHWFRTVPTLSADRLKPDDVDTDSEDHCADDTRYACMVKSRTAKMTKMLGW